MRAWRGLNTSETSLIKSSLSHDIMRHLKSGNVRNLFTFVRVLLISATALFVLLSAKFNWFIAESRFSSWNKENRLNTYLKSSIAAQHALSIVNSLYRTWKLTLYILTTKEIENNTLGASRYRISLRYLTSEHRERVRYWVEHEKRNSISTNNHVLFCLSYKHLTKI